jgi:DNA-binding XRE family transcriptional regulator
VTPSAAPQQRAARPLRNHSACFTPASGAPCRDPHALLSRHLGGKIRELRFHLLVQQPRITYWLAPGRRIILLTVFRKTRSAEAGDLTKPRRPAKPSTGPSTTLSTGRHPDMTSGHTSYGDLGSQRRDSDEYRQGHAEAQRAYLLGKAVRDRRLALGLSQSELAARAGMAQPALSRLEAGGVIPTIPWRRRAERGASPRL